jgi:hypothetical protein
VASGQANRQPIINNQTIQQSKIIKSTIESQAARQAGCWQSQRNSILSPACLQ